MQAARRSISLMMKTGLAWVAMLLAVACNRPNLVKIKGSDTVLPVAQYVAEFYYQNDSSTDISVTGGGSGVGLKALMDRNTDIAMTSRDIKLKEIILLEDMGLSYTKVPIAADALAVVVHPTNPINRLTREQLEAIFTGKITNWKDVGGDDRAIVPYIRETSSGTYEFFKEKVLQKNEYTPHALMEPSNGSLVESIKNDKSGIAYIGLPYIEPGIKGLSVSFDKGKTYVEPNDENAMNGSYPVVRPLFFFYLNENAEKVKPVIQFIFTPQGAELVQKAGALPLKGQPQ